MKEAITRYLISILPEDYFVLKVKISSNNHKIGVYLDGDYGVSIDDCGKVSRQLEEWLEEKPEVPEDYTLDISSAGLEEPLSYIRQLKKNVNRQLIIHEEATKYKGKLIYVDNEQFWLKPDKGETKAFLWNQIEKAKVDV